MQKHFPNVYIIAGPNGAGKTTFAKRFLPEYAHCPNFVNADLIAQGLSPFDPASVTIHAGCILLEQIRSLSEKKLDFAFETTLSGRIYISFLKDMKDKGYRLNLFFLWIPNVNLALSRIKERVLLGGHDVPDRDVKRRFGRSISNFFTIYQQLVDVWILFDNSSVPPRAVAKSENGKLLTIESDLFAKISTGNI